MKSIFVNGKNGVMVENTPTPKLFKNSVLCKMTHSLISVGTEKGIIKNCFGKTKKEILKSNIRLGYSGAGIVEEIMGDEIDLKVGERIAYYGGPYVSHSEYVVVPPHLVCKIPDKVNSDEAAFIGLGAIAMHGFRMGRVGLGEFCFVAGLGIIGNLCAQLASAAGCRVIVSDLNPSRVNVLKKCIKGENIDFISSENSVDEVFNITEKYGADAIFLCMSTESSKPMEDAIKMVRAGGRIVILGVLDIRIPREDFFYKEAEITISRAGGPGRYDVNYEKNSMDYPYQYVRWTEGRNIKEIMRLIEKNILKIKPMISKIIPLDKAEEAYKEITDGKDGMGYIIKW